MNTNNMDDFFRKIVVTDGLTSYHFKVILLLLVGEATQSQLAGMLNMNHQNIHRTCKMLLYRRIISISRKEGHNKFLRVNTNTDLFLDVETTYIHPETIDNDSLSKE